MPSTDGCSSLLRAVLVGVAIAVTWGGSVAFADGDKSKNAKQTNKPKLKQLTSRQEAEALAAMRRDPTISCGKLLSALREADIDAYEKILAQVLKLLPDQEKVALAFATQHHPELITLLNRLKTTNMGAYHAELAKILRSCDSIARMSKRKDPRYPHQLALWKAESRIRLAVARMERQVSKEIERELTSLLQQRLAAQVALQRLAAKAADEHAKRMQGGLDRMLKSQATYPAGEVSRIKRDIERRKGK